MEQANDAGNRRMTQGSSRQWMDLETEVSEKPNRGGGRSDGQARPGRGGGRQRRLEQRPRRDLLSLRQASSARAVLGTPKCSICWPGSTWSAAGGVARGILRPQSPHMEKQSRRKHVLV